MQRRGELVEMGAPQRRPATNQLEPLGQEHDCQGPWHIGAEALDRRAVDAQVLGLTRLEPDLEQVPAILAGDLRLGARQLRTEPNDLALVRGATRARREREVDGLEQIRLAGTIRPENNGEALAKPSLSPLVASEIAESDPCSSHTP